MRQKIYLKLPEFDKKLITFALESGVDGFITDPDNKEAIQQLSRTNVLTTQDLQEFSLSSKEVEEQAASGLQADKTVLLKQGWEIIPVENLLAEGKGKLALEVSSLQEARLAAGILEKGADYIVVLPDGTSELRSIVSELKMSEGQFELESAKITQINPVGLGHRVCVDTCSILGVGQGILTGNSGNFNFLVHAETQENPYVASRPFRINAGAVHAYVQKPGDQTSYLEELRAGDEVLVVDSQGQTSLSTVGRVKIEVRPLLLITAQTKNSSGNVFLQNAETIRLVRPDGSPVSVVSLQVGDEVLCHTDQAGRHFGMRIQENIEEK